MQSSASFGSQLPFVCTPPRGHVVDAPVFRREEVNAIKPKPKPLCNCSAARLLLTATIHLLRSEPCHNNANFLTLHKIHYSWSAAAFLTLLLLVVVVVVSLLYGPPSPSYNLQALRAVASADAACKGCCTGRKKGATLSVWVESLLLQASEICRTSEHMRGNPAWTMLTFNEVQDEQYQHHGRSPRVGTKYIH